MTDTPTIRTHTTTVGTDNFDQFIPVPYDWETGLPVLVVAGLPEGSTIRHLCDVPPGWQIQNTLVLCRPIPEPKQPATAREIAADELRVAERHGCGFTDIGPTAVADRIIDRLTVAGMLVEAPTGDDVPQADTPEPDLTWLFAAFDRYEASDMQPWRDQHRADVLAAVRALRDGAAR